MREKVNELLTAKTAIEYFNICVEISNVLKQYSIIAANIFYQLHSRLIDIIINDFSINFIIEDINKSVEDVANLFKWINSNQIKITKNNSTGYIIVKVVL